MKNRKNDTITILFRNENLIAVEKPSGLLVHPYKKETNERDHLMKRVREQTGLYLYPVHRIDRPVSGIVLFGLSSEVVRELQRYWHKKSTVKEYIALVKGRFTEAGEFNFPLFNEQKKQEEARTLYEPIKTFTTTSLLRIRIRTGRKHQIRRHFSRRCCNIIGDKKYGQGKWNRFFQEEHGLSRIFLHAYRLELKLPFSDEKTEIISSLPEPLEQVLQSIERRDLPFPNQDQSGHQYPTIL